MSKVSEKIIQRLKSENASFHASDNISEYIQDDELKLLVDEVSEKFEEVLKSLVIDTENDPNSAGTGRRLAKMYINEIMAGRYHKMPNVTAFPNEGERKYPGMIVVRSEIKSVCSHHWQPVSGVAYIGVIPTKNVIGLSKYTRIAQWCARRGTLQEELTKKIADEIKEITQAPDVGVYIEAEHGCCVNRGISVHNSLTQTTVLYGAFLTDATTKKEFFDNIQLQSMAATRKG